jgi:cell division protein FtsB
MINYLALLTALVVSAVSAYYSIIGLTAIFASAFTAVAIMGIALEIGKLITVSWLHRNWRTCPLLLKLYLTSAVIILMFISSMGIFGFLSKAHIEQTLNINIGQADQVQILEQKIEFQKQSLTDLDKQIAQIDAAISKLTDKGQASTSLQAADKQRKTRDGLVKRKEEYVRNISTYTAEKVALNSGIKKLEAEVGPLKYIAELVYSGAGNDQLEKAVRMVILLLVAVFDPLAVLLLLAANHGLGQLKNLTKPKEANILKIDDAVLGEQNVT